MQKRMVLLVAMLLLVVTFTGCPRHMCPPTPVIPPVQPPPQQEIQQGLIFEGSLFPNGQPQKSGLYPSIPNDRLQLVGDAFKGNAVRLHLNICTDTGIGKGGGYSDCNMVDFPIINGVFKGYVPLNPGQYWVRAELADKSGYSLFVASASAQVSVGTDTKVGLEFNFLDQYQFVIGAYNMPSVAMTDCAVEILEYSSDDRFRGWGHYADNRWVFNCSLPLDFNGGTMYFVTNDGDPIPDAQEQPLMWNLSLVPWMIDFKGYSFGQEWMMAYQPATGAGSLTPEITFAYEQKYIRVGGVEFNTVAEAVQQSANPVTVELGRGDYLGFWANGASVKDVRIVGQGANRTRLVRDDNDGGIISMDASVVKGGGYRLVLDDLTVSGYNNGPNSYAATIYLNGCAFEARNCFFEGYQNSLIYLVSARQVFVSNCWFNVQQCQAIAIDWYDPTLVCVQDSIFSGYNFEALYLYSYANDGASGLTFTNCCVSGGVPTGPEFIPVTNFVFADPMIDWQTKLPLPGSPCIGAATDGGNIGLIWAESPTSTSPVM